jgi:hypothetical protein
MGRSWAILGLVVMSASTAHAEEAPRVRLTFRTPTDDAGCPSERVFRDLVAARVGRDPFADDASRAIDATLTKRGVQFHGRVALFDASGKVRGERELDDRSCAELAESLAIAISILLDPFGRWARPAPLETPPPVPASPPPPVAPRVEPPTDAAPPAPPHPATKDHVAWMPTASVTSALGSAPDLLWGARFGLRLKVRSWSVSAEAAYDTMLSTAQIGRDRVEAERWFGALSPCLHLESAAVCATALMGVIHSFSASVLVPTTRRSLIADAGIRAGWSLWLGRTVGIEPWITATVPLSRTILLVSDEAIWRAPRVAGTVGLSMLVRGL